ncbi:hypothetical protein [Plantactinospora sonchi]|uniref:Uncharacterized protein n=1 Tax=Plantactinospora sonchi TaxID=1544735 RepID=A0ABU7S2P5_9ACTN
MALVDVLEDDEHRPEYGTLVVTDAWPDPGVEELPMLAGMLRRGAVDTQPAGTIACSGDGWLEARATDEYHRVRFEAHDSVPGDDRDDWQDVVELPYRCRGGRVGLGTVTGSHVDPSLPLGAPGFYRVRLSRRPAVEVGGDVFRLQFWPDRAIGRGAGPAPDRYAGRDDNTGPDPRTGPDHDAGPGSGGWPAPPRWLRRHRPVLVGPPPPALDTRVALARYRVFATDLVTIATWGNTSGEVTASWTGLAESLLVSVAQVRETVDWAVGRRALAVDGDLSTELVTLRALPREPAVHRYSGPPMRAPTPGPPWDGSTPPPRHGEPGAPPSVPEPGIPPPRGTHRTSAFVQHGVRGAESGPTGPASTLSLAVFGQSAPEPYLPPWGDPPSAGLVSQDGRVTVWRDGEPVVLARWRPPRPDERIYQALETRHGVLLAASSATVLVRPDGRVDPVGTKSLFGGALADDGRHFGYVEHHVGRHSYQRLHLVDLADGTRHTMPGDDRRADLRLLAIRAGVVQVSGGTAGGEVLRWRPGQAPEPTGRRLRAVDPQSGTALATADDEPGTLVVLAADGRVHRRLRVAPEVRLGPGGHFLYEVRHQPPGLVLHDLTGKPSEPRTVWLPIGAGVGVPTAPVWESPSRLLVRVDHGGQLDTRLLRVDLHTGAFQRVPLPPTAGHDVLPVTPLPR